MTFLAALSLLAVWLLSFLGLPLGIPPAHEEAIMSYVVPDECVFYASWAAMAKPDPASANQTEQLFAEPEVQAFAATLKQNALTAAIAAAKKNDAPPEQVEKIAAAVDLFACTLFTRPGAVYLTRLSPRGENVDVQGALIIKAGDGAPALEQTLTGLIAMSGAAPTEVTLVNRQFKKLSTPTPEPIDIVWSAFNGYLMVGLGPNAIEELSARIRAQKEPTWLTQLKANLPIERRSTITYINIKRVLDSYLPLGGLEAEKVATALGLKQITSYQSVSGLGKTVMESRSLLAFEGQSRGLLSLFDEKGFAPADMKHIPADSLSAAAFVFDPRKVFDVVMATIAEVEPQAAEQAKHALEQAQTATGIDIPDALGAFGSHWSIHTPAPDGGTLGIALIIEVRDKKRLADVEKNLLARFAGPTGDIPNVGRITRATFSGQTIVSLTPRSNVPVVPSWCLTEKQLIVAANPQAIETILSRASGAKSLAEVPEVAVLLSASGSKGPLALTYQDVPRAFTGMYAQAQALIPLGNMLAQQGGIPFKLDAAQLPPQQTIARHLRPTIAVMYRSPKGLESQSQQSIPGTNMNAATTGVVAALLLPAVQAAREAARRTQAANNIKQMLIALHNHHAAAGALPPAYTQTAGGKPLLSWRVAILPYLDQKPLYDQFHLDEPWDSEHNKQLIAKMPAMFRSPNSAAKPGMTNFLGVGGPHGVLGPGQPGQSNGTPFSAVTDGTANTIAIVEASDALAVEWTRPVDWVPDASDPLKGLLNMRPGGFQAGFVDGSVRFITKDINAGVLKSLFSRDDGNTVQLPGDAPPRGKAPPAANPPAKGKAPPKGKGKRPAAAPSNP